MYRCTGYVPSCSSGGGCGLLTRSPPAAQGQERAGALTSVHCSQLFKFSASRTQGRQRLEEEGGRARGGVGCWAQGQWIALQQKRQHSTPPLTAEQLQNPFMPAPRLCTANLLCKSTDCNTQARQAQAYPSHSHSPHLQAPDRGKDKHLLLLITKRHQVAAVLQRATAVRLGRYN